MEGSREWRLQHTLDFIRNGQSYRLASLDWNIPETTFRARVQGATTGAN